MTLEEWLAAMPATLAEFVAQTMEAAKTDDSFDPTRRRPEAWWYREVAAYLNTVEISTDPLPTQLNRRRNERRKM